MLKNISSLQGRDVEEVMGRRAANTEEKYKILELRDKIIRQHKPKLKVSVRLALKLKGTCPDMCPEKERYMREVQRRLSTYECVEAKDSEVDHRLAIKEYSRSSADQDEPLPHELRPVASLHLTFDYILHNIINRIDDENENLSDWYFFIWDRTRAIRKDLTQQQLCNAEAVLLMEKCARFHIYCATRLCELDRNSFDPKLNDENLVKCLQSLEHMYSDLALKDINCPNEAEFRAYHILMNLNDGALILRIQQQLSSKVQKSDTVQLALRTFNALNAKNAVAFFRLVKASPFLFSCILHRYFFQIRTLSLRRFLKCYSLRHSVTLPTPMIRRMLGFDEEAGSVQLFQQFSEAHGFLTDGESSMTMDNRHDFIQPSFPIVNREIGLIESKITTSVSEVLNGTPLGENPLNTYIPFSSFDENGYLKREVAESIEFESEVLPSSELADLEVLTSQQIDVEEYKSPSSSEFSTTLSPINEDVRNIIALRRSPQPPSLFDSTKSLYGTSESTTIGAQLTNFGNKVFGDGEVRLRKLKDEAGKQNSTSMTAPIFSATSPKSHDISDIPSDTSPIKPSIFGGGLGNFKPMVAPNKKTPVPKQIIFGGSFKPALASIFSDNSNQDMKSNPFRITSKAAGSTQLPPTSVVEHAKGIFQPMPSTSGPPKPLPPLSSASFLNLERGTNQAPLSGVPGIDLRNAIDARKEGKVHTVLGRSDSIFKQSNNFPGQSQTSVRLFEDSGIINSSKLNAAAVEESLERAKVQEERRKVAEAVSGKVLTNLISDVIRSEILVIAREQHKAVMEKELRVKVAVNQIYQDIEKNLMQSLLHDVVGMEVGNFKLARNISISLEAKLRESCLSNFVTQIASEVYNKEVRKREEMLGQVEKISNRIELRHWFLLWKNTISQRKGERIQALELQKWNLENFPPIQSFQLSPETILSEWASGFKTSLHKINQVNSNFRLVQRAVKLRRCFEKCVEETKPSIMHHMLPPILEMIQSFPIPIELCTQFHPPTIFSIAIWSEFGPWDLLGNWVWNNFVQDCLLLDDPNFIAYPISLPEDQSQRSVYLTFQKCKELKHATGETKGVLGIYQNKSDLTQLRTFLLSQDPIIPTVILNSSTESEEEIRYRIGLDKSMSIVSYPLTILNSMGNGIVENIPNLVSALCWLAIHLSVGPPIIPPVILLPLSSLMKTIFEESFPKRSLGFACPYHLFEIHNNMIQDLKALISSREVIDVLKKWPGKGTKYLIEKLRKSICFSHEQGKLGVVLENLKVIQGISGLPLPDDLIKKFHDGNKFQFNTYYDEVKVYILKLADGQQLSDHIRMRINYFLFHEWNGNLSALPWRSFITICQELILELISNLPFSSHQVIVDLRKLESFQETSSSSAHCPSCSGNVRKRKRGWMDGADMYHFPSSFKEEMSSKAKTDGRHFLLEDIKRLLSEVKEEKEVLETSMSQISSLSP